MPNIFPLFDTKDQRRRRKKTKQTEKITIVPKRTLNGKRNKIKERKEINVFPFLEGKVIGLEALATWPSDGYFGISIATEVPIETS